VGIARAKSKTRVVEQRQLTKGNAALLLMLSAAGAIVSATQLHGRYIYLGFAVVGIVVFIGFIRWNRRR
jgi:hypothetical protein